MYDIYDFGWGESIDRWTGYNQGGSVTKPPVGSGKCVSWKDLSPSLLECQNGVTLQYLADGALDEDGQQVPGCWHDVLSIPNGVIICEPEIVFSTSDSKFKPLFTQQLRMTQCNNDALCASAGDQHCKPEYGFSATLDVKPQAVSEEINLYWQLIRENDLVCAPTFPDCLNKAYPGELAKVKCIGCENCA